jgi:hypothetical protein
MAGVRLLKALDYCVHETVTYLRPSWRPEKPWAAQSGWSVGTLHIIHVDSWPHFVTPAGLKPGSSAFISGWGVGPR